MPADAPEGLCPKCLLRLGWRSGSDLSGEDEQESTAAYRPPSAAPTAAELAGYFPQLEIIELLGQGGMGAVYKARQRGLDRLVALKILPRDAGRDPAFAERFSREARALAKLNHPNIVTVYDFGQAGGLFYFLMEYVDGVNLRQTLRAGQLRPEQGLHIIPPLCEALQYAHDEGVVHRDIKPENILLDKKGRVKIADFGLARLLGRAPADARLTGVGQVMGTPHYMAPEQVERPLEVDHRADIYSLGVVFYELLTGELPLGRFAPPSRKARVDARLDQVVLKTLEKEPGQRYQHASEVKTDVESIGGKGAKLPAWMTGREYKSKATLWGLPLVHIASGWDPVTGKWRMAKGIIAIGDRAVGVVAIAGAYAVGVVAIGGGFGFGLLSIAGGLALGLLALGGTAAGGMALGGAAVGVVAVGGAAVGYYAIGGGAWGVHAWGGNGQDPRALQFFADCKDWLADEGVAELLRVSVPLFVFVFLLWAVFGINKRRE
jgi:tRNA A-37 threonylcarbamoyl transferase component Bud32